MVVKERVVKGSLYFGGKKIADKCEGILETECSVNDPRKIAINFPKKLRVTIGEFCISRNDRLSLIHGTKITNNWLKLHGGIMERQVAGRKRIKKF